MRRTHGPLLRHVAATPGKGRVELDPDEPGGLVRRLPVISLPPQRREPDAEAGAIGRRREDA